MRSLKTFIQLSKGAPDMSREVKKELAQNAQTLHVLSAAGKGDVTKEEMVTVVAKDGRSQPQNGSDMAAAVKRDVTHDAFAVHSLCARHAFAMRSLRVG